MPHFLLCYVGGEATFHNFFLILIVKNPVKLMGTEVPYRPMCFRLQHPEVHSTMGCGVGWAWLQQSQDHKKARMARQTMTGKSIAIAGTCEI